MTDQAPEVTYYDKEGNQIEVAEPKEDTNPITIVSQQVTIVDQKFIECPEAVATIEV